MKDKEYDKIISRLKAAKPELNDPQNLTAEIISAVEKSQEEQKPITALRILSWASSVAAVLLLGIFLYENSTPVVSSAKQINVASYNSYSFTDLNIENINTLNMINDAFRERKESKKEREIFYASIINRNLNF